MLVVLGLASLFVVISIVWPIVAIAKEQFSQTDYTYTGCIAGWYAQIMAMIGIIVFTAGLGYFFKGIIGYLDLKWSYGYMSYPILGALSQTNVVYLEQQRLVDLVVRAPSLLVAGPVIYFVFAYLSRTVSTRRVHAPYWVMRGSQLLQTIFLGTVSVLCGLLALNLVLGYFLISPISNQSNVPFGEMLGFALAFTGAFVAHIWIWRSFPGGTWWSPPEGWPGRVQMTPQELEKSAI
jgi:hypothetical protein